MPAGPFFLLMFRIGAGLAIAAVAALGWTAFGWDASLNVALSVMAAFILLQTGISFLWARPELGGDNTTADGQKKEISATPQAAIQRPNMHAEAAKLAITTQAVVLGLVSFSSDDLSTTVKVGAASLAGGVLIGSVMFLLVAQRPPPDGNRMVVASVMLSLLLWALGFGLLCLVAGNW